MGKNSGSSLRAWYERIFLPVGRLIAKTGISANVLTSFSLLTAIVCAFFFWRQQLFLGIFFLLFTGFVDMLDGSVARATGQSSRFGAVLDHTLDRYAEFFFLLGLGLGEYVEFHWIYIAFFSMIMASFIRGKAESVGGLDSVAGIGIERKEKVGIIILGAALTYWYPTLPSPWPAFLKNPLTIAVLLLAILSQYAAFLRLRYTYQHADK